MSRPGDGEQLQAVRQILDHLYPAETWQIERPAAGRRKPTFIARSARHQLFVKLGVEAEPLLRLGELGIAPPVIAAGISDGQRWTVQPWFQGDPPDRTWLRQHLLDVASLLDIVHTDPSLMKLVRRQRTIATDLSDLQIRWDATTSTWFERSALLLE